MPDWSSKLVKKMWRFRDHLTFQFGGHSEFPTPKMQSDTELTLDFQSAEKARSVMSALNNAGIGIVATAA